MTFNRVICAGAVALCTLTLTVNFGSITSADDIHGDDPNKCVVIETEAGPASDPVLLAAVEVPPYEMPEPESVAPPEEVVIDPDDLYILAHVICGEAQGCSRELQEAVGSVVLNRVGHPSYPNSIEGVVFQRGQYACTWDGNYYRTPTQTNWEVAEYLLREGSQLPENVIFQAQHKQGSYVYKKIGNEYFCGVN